MPVKMLTKFAVGLIATPLVCMSGSIFAQQRTPNQGASGILRAWPGNADWQVSLTRLADGGLGCLLLTGHKNQETNEQYFWGIRWRENSVALLIIDSNPQAIAGTSIGITIDRVPVGTYQIARRSGPPGGMQFVMAELPAPDRDRLPNLMTVGGAIQFVTSNSTYSAPLLGARQSMQGFQECRVEASHLGGASGPR
jgi:hypothetical protein